MSPFYRRDTSEESGGGAAAASSPKTASPGGRRTLRKAPSSSCSRHRRPPVRPAAAALAPSGYSTQVPPMATFGIFQLGSLGGPCFETWARMLCFGSSYTVDFGTVSSLVMQSLRLATMSVMVGCRI